MPCVFCMGHYRDLVYNQVYIGCTIYCALEGRFDGLTRVFHDIVLQGRVFKDPPCEGKGLGCAL